MPVKIPVRAEYNNSGSPTGLSEYQTNEFVGSLYGGTGYNTYSNGEILIGNSSGTLTKNTIQGEAGKITVTNNDGAILISLDADVGVSPATSASLGIVKIPNTNAVSQLDPTVTAGGTDYSNATNVATTGGTLGSSGLTVDITTSDGVVTAAVVNNGGSGYVVDDLITITGGNVDAKVTVQTIVSGGLAIDGYGNLSHGSVNASSGNEFTTLANLEVLKKLELDSNGHVLTAQKEMLYFRGGIQLIEQGNSKYIEGSGQDLAMAIVFGG